MIKNYTATEIQANIAAERNRLGAMLFRLPDYQDYCANHMLMDLKASALTNAVRTRNWFMSGVRPNTMANCIARQQARLIIKTRTVKSPCLEC